jgi:hypothetical protein
VAITNTVAQSNDRTLTRSERCEHAMEFLAEEVLGDSLVGSRSGIIFKDISQRVVGLLINGSIEGNGLFDDSEQVNHLVYVHVASRRDPLWQRIKPAFL